MARCSAISDRRDCDFAMCGELLGTTRLSSLRGPFKPIPWNLKEEGLARRMLTLWAPVILRLNRGSLNGGFRNPLTIYRGLSGPPGLKPRKSQSGKVSKKSFGTFSRLFPDSPDFLETFFQTFRGSRGGFRTRRARETPVNSTPSKWTRPFWDRLPEVTQKPFLGPKGHFVRCRHSTYSLLFRGLSGGPQRGQQQSATQTLRVHLLGIDKWPTGSQQGLSKRGRGPEGANQAEKAPFGAAPALHLALKCGGIGPDRPRRGPDRP